MVLWRLTPQVLKALRSSTTADRPSCCVTRFSSFQSSYGGGDDQSVSRTLPRDRGPREACFVGWEVGGVPGEAGGGGPRDVGGSTEARPAEGRGANNG